MKIKAMVYNPETKKHDILVTIIGFATGSAGFGSGSTMVIFYRESNKYLTMSPLGCEDFKVIE